MAAQALAGIGFSTSPASWRDRPAPSSWPTSGPTSSRSRSPARATTRASGDRPSSRARTAGRRARAPTTSAPTATSARSPSTSPARGPGARARAGRRLPTCWWRTSRSATWRATGWTTSLLPRPTRGLVYCSITGFGQTGPYAHRAGYDYLFAGHGRPHERHRPARDAAASRMKVGRRDRRPDVTGMYATVAILAALRHATRPARASTSTWRCSTPRWRWPANEGCNYLVSRRGAAARSATRTRTSCPTRCSRPPTAA